MVVSLERGADLHMAQLMPLPLTISCFSKIQIGFTFLVQVYPGSPGQSAIKLVCVCMCDDNRIYWYIFPVGSMAFNPPKCISITFSALLISTDDESAISVSPLPITYRAFLLLYASVQSLGDFIFCVFFSCMSLLFCFEFFVSVNMSCQISCFFSCFTVRDLVARSY